MKGLIIRKKWVNLILDGQKIWEMRGRPTHIRGRIALIEAGSGTVVGECQLTGCSRMEVEDRVWAKPMHRVDDLSLLEKWNHAWMLSDVIKYSKPIPYNHRRGAVVWVYINPAVEKEMNHGRSRTH